MKINTQLLIIQFLLVLLSVLIVLLNILNFYGIKSDASFINYGGRLRILNYKMAHIAHEILVDTNNIGDDKEELKETMDEYETTIHKLIEGSPEAKLKLLKHETTLKHLLAFKDDWYKTFKPYYLEIIEKGDLNAFKTVNALVPNHVKEIDKMVTEYSSFSESKVSKAILRNVFTILIIILVSIYSYMSVQNRVKKPIDKLLKELNDMHLIDPDLVEKLNLSEMDELATMSSYIDELIYDGLTKTYNRRTGLSKLEAIIEGDHGSSFTIIFLDINGLKEVNDNLGHEAGDKLIRQSVNVVKGVIRDEDFITRLGGDEFLLVLKKSNTKIASSIWSRILYEYAVINDSMENPFAISVSHGIAEYKKDGFTLEELLKAADKRMYEEKKTMKIDSDYKVVRIETENTPY